MSAGPPAASARAALNFVESGQVLGLGTGRAAEAFVRALAEQVARGLAIQGVPTSERTA
ncbi:ribose-5-phosphate isomerase RpiA, partial [Myxococcota bacterium]|nr:ribose-5-phosphate isomerase RpiA [Myxococcota bacterium]